jgi:hypothetical protein
VHPFGKIWWNAYKMTAHAGTSASVSPPLKWSKNTKKGYQKTLKDKLLFSMYCMGLVVPKGVPAAPKI